MWLLNSLMGFPGGSVGKEFACNAGDAGRFGLGSSAARGHGIPLQYSYWENPMDRGAWQAMVHEATKSQTHLKQLSLHWRFSEHEVC